MTNSSLDADSVIGEPSATVLDAVDGALLPLFRAIVDLVACARTLRIVDAGGWIPAETSGADEDEDALRRLLEGRGAREDEERFRTRAEQAHLVCVQARRAPDLDHILLLLRDDRACLFVRLGDDRLVVLVAGSPRPTGDTGSMRAVKRVTQLAGRAGKVAIGISGPIDSAAALPAHLADATEACSLADASGTTAVHAGEAWADITLRRLRRQLSKSATTSHPVAVLEAYDRRHGSELVRSLATWLYNNQDFAVTARTLNVHPNTLRYRIRRAAQLSGLDLDNSRQRMLVQLMISERD